MKKLLLNGFVVILLSLSSCVNDNATHTESTALRDDSLNFAKIKSDSISVSNSKILEVITIGDKTIRVIKKPRLSNVVKYEFSESNYRYNQAEREQLILETRIVFSSKSKVNGREGKFFPELNVFLIDAHNHAKYLGTMEYQLFKNSDLNTTYLEQIFDYKAKETFVCWLPVSIPLIGKLFVSVNDPDNKNFNVNRIVGKIGKDQ